MRWRAASRNKARKGCASGRNDLESDPCHNVGSRMAQAEKKLDIFPHIFPPAYFERMKRIAEGNPGLAAALKRWMHIPVLWNLEQRIRMMKRWPGYQQVLTLSMPAIEFLGGENETPE